MCLCKKCFNLRLSRHYQHNCFALKPNTSASQHEIATCDTWQLDSFSSCLLQKLAATLVHAAVRFVVATRTPSRSSRTHLPFCQFAESLEIFRVGI